MKEVTRHCTVYDFDELSEEAKERAINDYIEWLIETTTYKQGSPGFRRAVEKAESLQTPWFLGGYVWEYCRGEVLEGLRRGSYFSSGVLFA